MPDKIDTECFKDIQRLKELRVAHADVHDRIEHMSDETVRDQLEIKRLKKRKLRLKDAINKMESEMIPDLNA